MNSFLGIAQSQVVSEWNRSKEKLSFRIQTLVKTKWRGNLLMFTGLPIWNERTQTMRGVAAKYHHSAAIHFDHINFQVQQSSLRAVLFAWFKFRTQSTGLTCWAIENRTSISAARSNLVRPKTRKYALFPLPSHVDCRINSVKRRCHWFLLSGLSHPSRRSMDNGEATTSGKLWDPSARSKQNHPSFDCISFDSCGGTRENNHDAFCRRNSLTFSQVSCWTRRPVINIVSYLPNSSPLRDRTLF